MADRSFTDEELALIIRRAAQVQAMTPESRHSLADVQQIGAQVGLPPELIAAVAEGLADDNGERGTLGVLLGSPGRFFASGIVPRGVTQDDYPGLLDLIRSELRVAGRVTQVGSAFEWSLGESLGNRVGSLVITVAPTPGAAKIRVETNLQPMRRNLYFTGMFAGAVLGLILSVEAGAIPLMAAAVTTGASVFSWGLSRMVWPRIARAAEAKAERLRQSISAHLGRARLSGSPNPS